MLMGARAPTLCPIPRMHVFRHETANADIELWANKLMKPSYDLLINEATYGPPFVFITGCFDEVVPGT